MKHFFIFIFLDFSLLFILPPLFAQRAIVQGNVNGKEGTLPNASVFIEGRNLGTVTDSAGYFILSVPPGNISLRFSHIEYQPVSRQFAVNVGDTITLFVQMEENIRYLDQVRIVGSNTDEVRMQPGVVKIDPETAKYIPSAFGDFNRILVTLPGVVSNNELSSAYSVRGGNFDENLVYVNDIPIYRPFLVRSGQQEGLSFVNPDLVNDVRFSSGGWQPKYGDKLSSTLNVNYKKPTQWAGSTTLGLLGGGTHLEGTALNQRLSFVAGARYKTSQYLLNTLETNGEYLPRFIDVQSYLTYQLGKKTELGLLIGYANNRYLVRPENRSTTFGTLDEPFRLFVAFDGQETLTYSTLQSGLKLTHRFHNQLKSDFIASWVNTREREYFDVIGAYRLCDIDITPGSNNFNECISTIGIGANYDHARNLLDATLLNFENRNVLIIDDQNTFEFGLGYSNDQIDDIVQEYAFSDSADYVTIHESVDNSLSLITNHVTAYAQNTTELPEGWTFTYGARLHYWSFSKQWLVSPRIQMAYHPEWKKDLVFRAAVGSYQQPPFYRELRNRQGEINPEVKAQSSVHGIIGVDYRFRMFGREFAFLTEAYYKYLYNLIPYDVENVRIRYFAENNAVGYAAGIDFRVSGEFIPGAESWFSLGLLKTEEDIEGDGRGYLRRPTDQRVNLSIFFQDHFPNDPSLRVYLSMLYGTGFPFGPPNNPQYRNALKGPDYNRVDIGFSKQIIFGEELGEKSNFFRSLWVGLEVLNLLGVDNTLSFTWITDVNNRQYAVPNRLSARFLNLKIIARY
jgi:hypothetical protein